MHANLWKLFFFLSPPSRFFSGFFFFLPPLNSYNTGVYFHTLPGGHQCSEGGGGDSHYGGRSVDGSKPDMTLENNIQAGIEVIKMSSWSAVFMFSRTILILALCFVFFFNACRSFFWSLLCWPFFFFSGASSVFINREDTSVSVAVMHTGRALMKTDALSVEAVAGGGGRGGGVLQLASPACSV